MEEYYSDAPDRVRTEGYVVYDEERQAFIYVVVEERSFGEFRSLMRKMSLTAEMRNEKMVLAMAPILVEGSLEPMEKSDVERAVSCLQESDVVEIYADYAHDDSNAEIYDAYFGDKYRKVLEAMCMKLESGGQGMDWYYLERGAVNGMAKHEIRISVLAEILRAEKARVSDKNLSRLKEIYATFPHVLIGNNTEYGYLFKNDREALLDMKYCRNAQRQIAAGFCQT